MVDFWEDYDGTNSEKIPSMRGIDYERIKAYCEAIGVDFFKQSINAKFMNEMEDWYLNLAKQYSALDKIRADVINIADGKQNIKVRSVLRIIDKYMAESEGKE